MVDQTITNPISGSSLDFSKSCLGVNQDVREDPELDNLIKKFQLSSSLNLIKPFPKNVVSDHVKCIEVNISHFPVRHPWAQLLSSEYKHCNSSHSTPAVSDINVGRPEPEM